MARGNHRTTLGLVVALVFVFGAPTEARAEGRILRLQALRVGDWLSVDLIGSDLLDPRTRSTIEAGLPGSCDLHLVLEREGQGVVAQRRLRRELELDLWEGRVWLRGDESERSFGSLAAADSAWSRFEGIRLRLWRDLTPGGRYRVLARLEVSPLGPDHRREVSRWVSRREDEDRHETSLDLGGLLRYFAGDADEDSRLVARTEYLRVEELPRAGEQP